METVDPKKILRQERIGHAIFAAGIALCSVCFGEYLPQQYLPLFFAVGMLATFEGFKLCHTVRVEIVERTSTDN